MLLPERMGEASKSLLEDIGAVLPVVTGIPATVEQFVNKKQVVAESQLQLDKFHARKVTSHICALTRSHCMRACEHASSVDRF
jgi:hypothetical protein